MLEILNREFIYFWYYFTLQFSQIFGYWVAGMLIGSAVSVFFKDKIHGMMRNMKDDGSSIVGIVCASVLGVISPLCMYGTIPIAASFSKGGIKDEWLASFMMSSILLNPQLIIYSAALGIKVLCVRIVTCFICGIVAGLIIRFAFKKRSFFTFKSFEEPKNKDTDPNMVLRFLKNLYRNLKATGLYFLLGIILSALFQRYIPQEAITRVFGGNEAWGVLMASTIGVPLYVCGGGTIPIIKNWLANGMSLGSAAAFMITGPATKITKHFAMYWVFVILFSCVTGIIINMIF